MPSQYLKPFYKPIYIALVDMLLFIFGYKYEELNCWCRQHRACIQQHEHL